MGSALSKSAKALVIMRIRRLYSAYRLLAFLDQETDLTKQLREQLSENGWFPSRRTWERRLAKLPDRLPALIGCFGRYLVTELQPWGKDGKTAAIDNPALCAKGGVWHKKDREAGVVPHSSIDTEAHWSKSGYHGWWYGWKLHLATTAAALWIPLAAQLAPANVADQEEAPALVRGPGGATNQAFCAWCYFPLPTDFALSVRISPAFGKTH